ncbi:XPG domain containing-domain-containing protein [Camillea tinctor]|nr:XPG domain containing-domain-containing protein [Camillea tinctor]
MGIPGIITTLRGYGSYSLLSADTVVIDGPSLVFRVFEGILKQRPYNASFMCMPSYSFISRATISWLDTLRDHGVNVRRIYFDGYLPPSKWDVRRARLIKQSDNTKKLLLSSRSGAPVHLSRLFRNVKTDMSITRVHISRMHDNSPRPPFLVPAVLEELVRSEHWGPLIKVVPGEADMFCAEDVRLNGGTVITTDSDFLVKDLGPNGSLAFFADIEAPKRLSDDDEKPSIGAYKVSPYEVCKQIGIADPDGISRAAFESRQGRFSFPEALEHIKAGMKHDEAESLRYHDFMQEHRMTEYISPSHPILDIISTLDPRISEVVVQSLLLRDQTTGPRGPGHLSIFLPVLIEHHDMKSAWYMSTPVRQLAYSVLCSNSDHIIEYRVLDQSTAVPGRQVEIPRPEEAVSEFAQLVETLSKLGNGPLQGDLRWFGFATCQDIGWSASEERTSQLANLIYHVTDELDEMKKYSWDLIHFTASFHASLYSLRILKQLLGVATFTKQHLSEPALQLREILTSFPSISEWPTIEDMPELFSKFREANAVNFITNMLGLPDFPKPRLQIRASKSKKQRKPQKPRAPRIRPTSVNPFAVLNDI